MIFVVLLSQYGIPKHYFPNQAFSWVTLGKKLGYNGVDNGYVCLFVLTKLVAISYLLTDHVSVILNSDAFHPGQVCCFPQGAYST